MAWLTEFKEQYKDIHLATADDNDNILKFFATIAMDTEVLQLRYTRKPDFFDLIEQQGLPSVTFLFKNKDDSVGGVSTITSRQAWVKGEMKRINYHGDLRVSAKLNRRTRMQWRGLYADIVERYHSYEDLGFPDYSYAIIMDGNKDAIRALLKPKASPAFRKMEDFNSINIFAQVCSPVCKALSRRRLRLAGYEFSYATDTDLAELKQFLYAENKNKQLGIGYTETGDGELERRFDVWQSFGVESFVLVRKNGRITACCAPWSNGRSRRVVIEKAPLPLRILGGVMPLFGEKPIKVNSELKTLYLTSVEIDAGLTQDKRANLLGLMVDFLFLGNRLQGYNILSILNNARCDLSQGILHKGYLYTTQKAAMYQVLPDKEVVGKRFLTVGENELLGFDLARPSVPVRMKWRTITPPVFMPARREK
jgi:hypothetical protein